MTQKNWRYSVDADDWFRSTEKRLMHEERRPVIREASTLLGPGFDQYAIQTFDWNNPACMSNGFFYSTANQVQNSPGNTKDWMGITEGTGNGDGLQTVWQYLNASPAAAIEQWSRRFWSSGGVTNYGLWQQGGGGGGTTPTLPDLAYTFVQGTPSATWVINHPLTFFPSVTIVDSTGRQTEGDVVYTDADTVTITFSAAFSGKAYLS